MNNFDKVLEESKKLKDAIDLRCYIMAWVKMADLYKALNSVKHAVRISDEFVSLGLSETDIQKRFDSLMNRRTLVSADRFFNCSFNFLKFSVGKLQMKDILTMSGVMEKFSKSINNHESAD